LGEEIARDYKENAEEKAQAILIVFNMCAIIMYLPRYAFVITPFRRNRVRYMDIQEKIPL
jgi:hypothetical protein